ncbi:MULTISPECIES: DUF3078 domain-containing protein [unclassified Alistipes]|uniref:DUF3078 domain-containing protein n=1 Tax=unclassified Alistipes TaxID=2608932 RepID=UPI0023BBB97C|nr:MULTISPECIES: DUF3078 domain-containing protein [unclassified Alistipes]MCX4282667.1 DUF3078 domain-containing protein [Alistipes sp.]MDE6876372.1 DUF3078 domain-containing protein [Alistipes sp.]HUN13439.1 DUF3078 domain-containing protein [Alistipes sp.]
MKFHSLLLLLPALAAAPSASAQFSIDEVDARQENVTFRDPVKSTPVDVAYFNRARYRAERAAIRKERNKLEFGGGLQGALTSYNDPWIKVSGGDNSIALMANLFLNHTYTKNLFSVETKFIAKFGYNRMKVETEVKNEDGSTSTSSNGVWFKNQDEFDLSVAPSFKMTKNWSYGAIFKFRSQFANGYISRTQQEDFERKSAFMAPGYLDISLGITYKCPKPKFPIVVNISPIALSAVFVESAQIRENKWDKKEGWQTYGLAGPDKSSKYEGGSSVQIDFDRTFGRKGIFRYRTSVFSFYGWITDIGQRNKISDYSDYMHALDEWNNTENAPISAKPNLPIHPTVRWTNTIDIKATKYLSTTLNFELYYNRAQNVDVQTKTLLSVGLAYTFKNK